MEVVEPGDVQRSTRLLPGSREKEELRVSSLDELKEEMEQANKKGKKRSLIIKAVVLSTISIVILSLALSKGSSSKSKKAFEVMKKIFRYLGYGSAAYAFINGFNKSAAGNIKITNPGEVRKPDMEKALDKLDTKNKEDSDPESRNIRSLAVTATLDTLIASGLVTPREVKNRAKAYNFRRPQNVNKDVVKDMVNYGKKL